jgi:hypothetical protein
MALWIGIITFLFGGALWYRSQGIPDRVPRWMPRLGIGTSVLGLGTLSLSQPGLPWLIASICFSIIAIILIASVVNETWRRR